ncbi:hypothetical protein JCM8547_001165 [Rhodosporidiobolus lusitaniae]
MNGYDISPTGAGPSTRASAAGGAGFFTSNRPPISSSSSSAVLPANQAFLPPLQPAPTACQRPPSGGGGGATLLSDEDTQSDSGGAPTPAASSTFLPAPAPGAGAPGGFNLPAVLANLPPLAPAPSSSSSAGTPKPPGGGGGRAASRTPSVSGPSGGAVKGKGKAKDGEKGKKAAGTAGGAVGGEKGKKRGQQVGPDGRPLPKKKKAGRACAACQKAHLTCDDSRPCARCVKKGCADECVDGARKKAKYLQEIPDELLHRGHQPAGAAPGTPQTAQPLSESMLFADRQPPAQPTLSVSPSLQPPSALPTQQQAPPPQPQPQPFFDFTAASTPAPGVSSVTDPTLTAQTSVYDPSSFLSFPPGATPSNPSAPSPPNAFSTTSLAALDPSSSLSATAGFGSEAANLEYAILSSMLNGNGFALDTELNGTSGLVGGGVGFVGGAMKGGTDGDPMLLDGPQASTSASASGGGMDGSGGAGAVRGGGGGYGDSPAATSANGSTSSGVAGLLTAEEAYRSVTKPYPYAQSYHYLVKHLKERFEKNDILRIIRALATFRPSLIALQMPLTEEDETFVERTFQRTLVELNKLISFSGTPTVVWRRTGEICLVGTEFCLLTGWKREELVGKKYIFELFDTASVVEYYESFAKHAFESTATSITMQCVVLGPDGRPVPCAFCFSVRRDLFSCPFLVIGSFLPVLV